MPILDRDGRLFGRVNLVDAATLVVVLLLLPIGVATYRVFGVPRPEIVKLDPETVRVDGDRRVRIEGRNLRPYMHAFIARAGQPAAFVDPPTNPNEATLLLEQPTLADLKLPAVEPGVYDLYLYDEGREVARRLSAFTVIGPETRQAVVLDTAVIDMTVRFDAGEELAALIKPGDIDTGRRLPWALKPAVVLSVRRLPRPARPMSLQLSSTGVAGVTIAEPRERLEAVVRVGVVRNHGAWEYEGRRRFRAGETFMLGTSAYIVNGLITRIVVVPGVSPQNAPSAADRP